MPLLLLMCFCVDISLFNILCLAGFFLFFTFISRFLQFSFFLFFLYLKHICMYASCCDLKTRDILHCNTRTWCLYQHMYKHISLYTYVGLQLPHLFLYLYVCLCFVLSFCIWYAMFCYCFICWRGFITNCSICFRGF